MSKNQKSFSPRPAAGSSRDERENHGATTPAAPGKLSKPVTLAVLDEMPAGPARNLKDMTLLELEEADRSLRAMPEKLENMSGVVAVLNGLVLHEIKGRLVHGEWSSWLQNNYGKAGRTARSYMQLSEAFTKSAPRCHFCEQLTLGLFDDTRSNRLDVTHPVIKQVVKWTDGRSYRKLREDESPTQRGGDTSKKKTKKTPEEIEAELIVGLQEDCAGAKRSVDTLGVAYRAINDKQAEDLAECLEKKAAEIREWLNTPKSKRPALDAVKAIAGEKH